jgi:hypothetical protein
MKRIYPILGAIIFTFLFTSCESVIKVPVKSGPAKLVVDAFVNNLNTNQKIRLTKSIGYFDPSRTEPGVTGATVAILDTTAFPVKVFLFADSGKGNYIFKPNPSTGDTFTIGHNYALIVVDGKDTLFSLSKMNPTVTIDSLHLQFEIGNGGFKRGNYVELFANDLKGLGDNYWIKTYNNDTFQNLISEINLAQDMGNNSNGQDGGLFIWPIRYGAINNFQKPRRPGTKVRIEVHSISLETYFWLNLVVNENLNGGLFATPPANIGTNIFPLDSKKSVPVAGFFCMSATASKEVLIP